MSEEVLSKIKAWKLLALERAFIALGTHQVRVELYKKADSKDRFNLFSLKFHGDLEKGGQGIDVPIDQERFTPEQYSQIIGRVQELGSAMHRLDYKPPTKIYEIIMHLWIMYQIYKNKNISWPPSIEDTILDFSFIKLITNALHYIDVLTAHAEREFTRTQRSSAKKKKNVEESPVYEIFFKLRIKDGTKLNRVVEDIFERLQKEMKEPPSRITIRRHLEGDPKIMQYFQKIGKFWVYQM